MSSCKRNRSGSRSADTPDKRIRIDSDDETLMIKHEDGMKPHLLMPGVRTFRDNEGDVQHAFAWDTRDRILALRTAPREGVSESVFLPSRTILERDSPVFRDALKFPQSELFEGHPIVTVQDHPQDLHVFLEALHDHRTFFSNDWKNNSIVPSLLRLSTKYQVCLLREQMETVVLEDWYSSDLESYHIDPWSAANRKTDVISLNLAKECGLSIVLPDLLYRCAVGWTLSEIISAPIRPREPPGDECLWFYDESLRFQVIKVHAAMGHWLLEIVETLLGESRDCKRRQCRITIPEWNKIRSSASHVGKASDILNKAFYDYEGLCSDCDSRLEVKVEEFMRKVWSLLPETAGLPSWESLKSPDS